MEGCVGYDFSGLITSAICIASRMLIKACLWFPTQLTMSEMSLRCVFHLHSGKAGNARTLDTRLPAAEARRQHLAHFCDLVHEFTVHPLSGNLPLLLTRSLNIVHYQKRCEPPQTLEGLIRGRTNGRTHNGSQHLAGLAHQACSAAADGSTVRHEQQRHGGRWHCGP